VLNELQSQQGRRGNRTGRGLEENDRPDIMPLPVAWPSPAQGNVSGISTTANCGGYDIGHADEAGCRVRLQRAAIPGLTVGRITSGQLGLSGLFGNFGARLGLGGTSETSVTISLRNVQELSLDAWRLERLRKVAWQPMLSLARAETLLASLGQLRGDLVERACNGDANRLAREGIEVMVINRVFYAGGMEYGFTHNAESAVRLAVDIQSVLANQPQAPVIPSLPTVTATGGAAGAAAAQSVSPQVAAATAAGTRVSGLLQGVTGEAGSGARGGKCQSGRRYIWQPDTEGELQSSTRRWRGWTRSIPFPLHVGRWPQLACSTRRGGHHGRVSPKRGEKLL
jgi:hypothetical protein